MQAGRLMREGTPPKVGMVHFGPGAFFRAFNAVYTDEVMEAEGGNWGICAVSLRSTTYRDLLAPQGNVYTSVSLTPVGAQYKVIGSVASVLVAREDPSAVVSVLADPAVKIVSLTITEKGYCHAPATGRLMLDHPDVAYDLSHPDAPRSAPGLIVAGLTARRAAGLPPFTVLSCDNLPANGRVTQGVILDYAKALDSGLADWIAEEGRFPATMVDRITPATTGADIAALEAAKGYFDPACVTHEPFRQWVIEDSFVDGQRPDWGRAGAQFVRNVEAHELMKLRCLNGVHSTLAYLGYLSGHETIADTVANPAFARMCEKLWSREILPTVPQPEGEDLPAYAKATLERFRNPAIRHRTWQIAMDGSQKLPQRLLGTVTDNLRANGAIAGLSLGIAGWMRYVSGVDDSGAPIDVRDPLAGQLRAACDSAESAEGKVAALLSVEDVFEPALAQNKRFRATVTAAYLAIANAGAASAVSAYGS